MASISACVMAMMMQLAMIAVMATISKPLDMTTRNTCARQRCFGGWCFTCVCGGMDVHGHMQPGGYHTAVRLMATGSRMWGWLWPVPAHCAALCMPMYY